MVTVTAIGDSMGKTTHILISLMASYTPLESEARRFIEDKLGIELDEDTHVRTPHLPSHTKTSTTRREEREKREDEGGG